MLKLNDSSLLETRAFLGGVWQNTKQTFAVTNPATGENVAMVCDVQTVAIPDVVAKAKSAQSKWASRTGKERAFILRRWFDLINANAEDLAAILTAEMGKPLSEAHAEVAYGASFIEWFAEEAKRVYGTTIPAQEADKRIVVLKQPIGVVGAITPWNFPNAMITRKLAPALAVGCAVVLRPSELTPLSALALAVLAERAGVPKGVLSIIPSTDATGFGKEICSNPMVAKISFTGSTRVGKILMEQSAGQIKKLSLELGGNAPFIVFDDADIDAAVEGAIVAKFRNAGQACVCANRLYVQSGVYDLFAQKFAKRVAQLNVGDGREHGVDIGPMINGASLRKVRTHLDDALAKGAEVTTGGQSRGAFFEPTVVIGATPDMQIASEETFGPLAPLFRFENEEEVIALANDSEFGLSGYFFSKDHARVWRVAERLETGIVGINTGLISTEVAPFGGIKQSGLGREGSFYGADDYLELKYLSFGGIS